MKVRKFKNLWLMGLIMFGVILGTIYILKLVCPEFVVGIAEIPAVVRFGNYVNTHLWAYYLFTFCLSLITNIFYVCACCRKKRPSLRDWCIMISQIIFLFVVERYLPQHYLIANLLTMLIVPTLINFLDKKSEIKYLYSTIFTFSIHSIAQLVSLYIRDLQMMVSYPNIATLTILMIDVYIWIGLLYNYYNYKENK